MSLRLPSIPEAGDSVTPDHVEEIVDYLRSITPRSSDRILVSFDPGGVFFEPIIGQPAVAPEAAVLNILYPRRSADNQVACTHGYVFVRGIVGQLSTAGNAATKTVSGAGGTRYMYVKAGINPATLGSVTLEVEDTAPWGDGDLDLNQYAFLLLATLTWNASESKIEAFTRRYAGGDWYLHGL